MILLTGEAGSKGERVKDRPASLLELKALYVPQGQDNAAVQAA
jgi:hypothetical protein